MGFYKYWIETQKSGYRLFHYIDKPDLNMNELVQQVEKSLDKKLPSVRLPYWLGYIGGLCFNLLAKLTGKKFTVSTVRVKKFCATTQFDATAAHNSGFKAPFTLSEGLWFLSLRRELSRTPVEGYYEFIDTEKDEVVFESE